jgi:ABC-2 type transport system permease protein
MLPLLRLELRRMLSDKRFLILMLMLPIAMYLLFSNLFGGDQPSGGLDGDVALMISMAAMGAIGAAMTATGPRIAQERSNGWLRQLKVMPLPAGQVVAAKTIAAMAWALPAIILVDLTAVLDHGVHLAAWQWLGIGGLLWLGSATFAALGTFLGYLADADSAFPVMYGILLFLSAIGGLWMPLSQLPTVLQRIGRALPSNRLAELGWNLAAGQAPSLSGVLILAGWLVGFGGLALFAYRRANPSR